MRNLDACERHTVGDTDLTLRVVRLSPGADTGWHYHHGTCYGRVLQGTLSHFDAAGRPDGVYPPGSVVVEPGGAEHVHIGRNFGDDEVVLEVLYVLPKGSPLAEPAAEPAVRWAA